MKKIFFSLLFSLTGLISSYGQLPNGSIAPDFTVTDLNGNQINLYSLLNAGKTVYIDIFASWCHICWDYKNTGALETIWETYGPSGTNEAYVIAIEGDANTNLACLFGPNGCNGSTQGNWTTGTSHPIVHDATIAGLYDISYYPTVFMVCPSSKTVWETGPLSATGLWNKRAQYCSASPLTYNVNNVTNVICFGTPTGAIDIEVTGGAPPYSYLWSNNATTQDISNLTPNNYKCTVTGSNGSSIVVGPLFVSAPASALSVSLVESTPLGCNGNYASLTVQGNGGWNQYNYAWSNGGTLETIAGLGAGNYTVTVTDYNNCAKIAVLNVAPAVYPVASVAAPPSIKCNLPSIQLDGSGSSTGANYTYLWTASNGGNIVSGANTLTPIVNAAGIYTLKVTNLTNNCVTNAVATVLADIIPPIANAGPNQILNCLQNTVSLQGNGSAGNNFSYLWTASNGGHIVAGMTTLTPIVDSSGTYQLKISNANNGCISTATTTVVLDNVPPISAIVSPANLNCTNSQVQINAGASSQGNNFSYNWTSTNGNIVSGAATLFPIVDVAGNYVLQVNNNQNGCTSTANATVNQSPMVGYNISSLSNTSCFGAANGSVTVAGTGGNNAYNYLWSNGSTTATITDLAAGTYQIIVTDGENCSATASIAIAQPELLTVSAFAMPQSANGINDGSATALPLGGTPGFSYLWSTGANTASIENLAPGTYTVTVIDQNGCTNTQSVAVNAFNCTIAAQISTVNISCFGAVNGMANVTLTGAGAPVTYSWNNGATTATIANLNPGTYTVYIVDANNCPATVQTSITEPALLAANAAANAETSFSGNNGTATLNPIGGVAPYTFAWSNGASTQTITGLAPGNYVVVVTDANACTAQQSVTVAPYICLLTAQTIVSNASCPGTSDGALSLVLNNGTPPYTFLWSNGDTGNQAVNLLPGVYTVSVIDNHNCIVSDTLILGANDLLAPVLSCPNNIYRCANDNMVDYDFPTATDNCTILINSLQLESGLMSGAAFPTGTSVQVFSVSDEAGNRSTCSFEIQVYPPVQFENPLVSNDLGGQGQGSIVLNFSGGTAPFTYSWTLDGQLVGTTQNLNNVYQGLYTVAMMDALGCTYTLQDIAVSNTTSVKEPTWLQNVQIQPNPTNGFTQIVFETLPAGFLTILVTDQTGRFINRQISTQQNTVLLDCTSFSPGVYWLRFSTQEETGIRKLVVGR
ncbi:MAG: T9SS type A sorting domain-containing protein [Saprospiraceae bacterium]|nr:T9SS type A sorting domain-containing protein [Saprospiraceae bacterium]